MQIFTKLSYIFIFIFIFFGCTEKISYSGKIQDLENNYDNIKNKKEVINLLGEPNFVDFIEKKFFYYSEKNIRKNFFDNETTKRNIISFEFDKLDNIKKISSYNINDYRNLKISKDKTESIILKRGLIEKLFGGVGKNPLSNAP